MKLHPFDEVVREAGDRIRPGVTVFQQFACAGCGVEADGGRAQQVLHRRAMRGVRRRNRHPGQRLQLHDDPHATTVIRGGEFLF